MNKPYINLTDKRVPKEVSAKRRAERELMAKLGLYVPYTSGERKIDTSGKKFSKYYETEDDYESDKLSALELIYGNKEIPKDLEQRLIETKAELESR